MRMLHLLLALFGFYIKVNTSYPECILNGQMAFCAEQRHHQVPALPPNITHLFLDRNYISEINRSSFRDLKELLQLDLGGQRVNLVIRNNSFLTQTKLIKLILGSNFGLRLEIGAFSGLFNLQSLYLDYCSLSDSILSESYFEQLLSLEMLDLFGNQIRRLLPDQLFFRLTKFTQLNLKSNKIEKLCEDDLVGFRGKYFRHLNLQNNHFFKTRDMQNCGNPFREMAFEVLDLSNNGLNVKQTRQFFKAIQGTPIAHLIYSGQMGSDFSFDNLADPDESTFEGLQESSVSILELSQTRISTLHRAVFKPLKDVIIIDISRGKINQIRQNAFDGLQSHLRLLNLSFNLLGQIELHTFDWLTELRVLDLSYNHIGVLGHSAFRGLPKLRGLFLTGNSLKVLGLPTFLPNVEQLHLGENRLTDLYNIKLLGKDSTYVDVSDNKLTNLEDVYILLNTFKNLKTLFFGGNGIKWCTLNGDIAIPLNNSLQVLDLHDSSLWNVWEIGKCLDLFDNMSNLLGLNISSNSISTLPLGIFRGLNLILEIDLSSNSLTYLWSNVFPSSLKTLHLSNNFLTIPDPSIFYSLDHLNLSGNLFHCDCNLEPFLEWLNTTYTLLSSVEEYRCEFPATLRHLPLLNFSSTVESCEKDDEQLVQTLKLALFIFSALLTAIMVVHGVVYTHFRGHIFILYKKVVGRVLEGPEQRLPINELQYDAFICFSNKDYGWAEEALLKKLDNQFAKENIFHCCFEARDFLPGEDHLSNIRDAIWGSRKTLCVVSNEFLKDGWCLEAFSLAQGRMLEELTNVLVMVVVGKVAHYQLMKCNAVRAFAGRREYLTWPEDPQDLDWFYDRLVTKLLKETKTKKENQTVEYPVALQPEEDIQLEDMREIAV